MSAFVTLIEHHLDAHPEILVAAALVVCVALLILTGLAARVALAIEERLAQR